MTYRPTIQERAHQLASQTPTLAGIRQRLLNEGYDSVDAHLASPSLRLAMKRARRQAAKAVSEAEEPPV
jgi:hypothetical protein